MLVSKGALKILLMRFLFVLIASFGLSAICEASENSPVSLNRGQDFHPLGPVLEYFEDTEDAYDIASILREQSRLPWKQEKTEILQLGFSPHRVWFRFRVNNLAPEIPWLAEVGPFNLQHIEFFSEGESADTRLLPQAPLFTNHYFSHLIPRVAGERTFFFSVRSEGALIVRAALRSLPSFHAKVTSENLFYGLFYGAILLLVIFNLVSFVLRKDGLPFLYTLYLVCVGLTLFSIHGLSNRYLWPESPWWNIRAINVLACLSNMTLLAFVRKFFKLSRSHRFSDLCLTGLIALFGIAIPANLLFRSQGVVIITNVLVLTACVSVLACCAIFARSHAHSRFLIFGFGFISFGALVYVLRNLGIVESNILTDNSLSVGVIAKAICVTVGIGVHELTLERERKHAVHLAQISERLRLEEHAMAKLRTEKARLEELGHVAVKLGDALNNPLNAIVLAVEEIQDLDLEKDQSISGQDRTNLLGTISRKAHLIHKELLVLERFKHFAPPDSVEQALHGEEELERERLPRTGTEG